MFLWCALLLGTWRVAAGQTTPSSTQETTEPLSTESRTELVTGQPEEPVATEAPVAMETASPTGQLLDGFEGVKPSWRILPSRALASPARLRRSDVSPHAGRRCEQISHFAHRGAEQILAVHDMPSAAAIEEFQIRTWLRGTRPGYQLMGRVRLPRTLDEHGQPLSFYIHGDVYTAVNMWQKLRLNEVDRKIGDGVRALRIERGKHVDSTEAYLDQVVINTYGGAGSNVLWIDDLTLDSAVYVNTRQTGIPGVLASKAPPTADTAQRPASDWLPRAVTHHGESFGFLRGLGFNTIWLERAATAEQLAEARKRDVWLICPPPQEVFADGRRLANFDRVVAWDVQSGVRESGGRAPAQLRSSVSLLREHDPLKRPTIALGVNLDEQRTLERLVDIVVESQPNSAHRRSNWIGLGTPLVPASRWIPLRNETWSSVVCGYRGFVLRTGSTLQPHSAKHAAHLAELFNLELSMLRPWIIQPQLERRVYESGSSRFVTSYLSNDHSSLVLLKPVSRTRSSFARGYVANNIEIPTSTHRDAFRMEPGGLSPIVYRRVAGGISVTLNPSKPDGLLVFTDRTSIVQALSQHLGKTWPRTEELLIAVLRKELLDLDQRIQHAVAERSFQSLLRGEVHALHGRIAPLLDQGPGSATFRELDHVLGQLERAHERLSQ